MKTALITGGSRGIGRATVEKFLEEGYRVISTSTTGNFTYSNENLMTRKLEMQSHYQIVSFVEWMEKEGGKIDVLVNNAAVLKEKDATIVNIAYLRQTLNVNLIGTIQLTEELLLRGLINSGGRIVNISSRYGLMSQDYGSDCPSYAMSKVALNKYTKILAPRVAEKGIEVYSFGPGWVKTDMGGSDAPRDPKEPAAEIYELVNSERENGVFYSGLEKGDW